MNDKCEVVVIDGTEYIKGKAVCPECGSYTDYMENDAEGRDYNCACGIWDEED